MRMATLLEEVRKKEEGFASDAQRRAAFASGYKEKGKKKKEEVTEKFSSGMIDKLRKAYEPLKGKKIPPAPLMKIFDKIDSNKAGLEQLYKADIPFVSMMAMSRLMLKHNYKAADINKLGKIRREEFKESEMTEKLTDGNLSLKDTVLEMWKEAVSPAQQAAIAISKKEKGEKPKDEEGNAFGKALQAAKDKGEKTFVVSGKKFDVKTKNEIAPIKSKHKPGHDDDESKDKGAVKVHGEDLNAEIEAANKAK